MPSPINIFILCLQTNIFHFLTFFMFPIKFKSAEKALRVTKITSKIRNIMFGVSFTNIVILLLQLISGIINFNISHLIILLFHGFSSVMIFATAVFAMGYIVHASEFCGLLNCMVPNKRGILSKISSQFHQNDYLLSLLVLSVSMPTFLIFVVLIPVGDMFLIFMQPDNQQKSKAFCVFIVLLKLPTLYAAGLIGAVTVTISFLTLKEIDDTFSCILQKLKRYGTYHRNIFGIYYRQIQMLTILANECFKTRFRVVVEFMGSVVCIMLAYIYIVYRKSFSLLLQANIIVSLSRNLDVVCFILHFGSKTLVKSSKISKNVQLLMPESNKMWYCKYIKSFLVVAL